MVEFTRAVVGKRGPYSGGGDELPGCLRDAPELPGDGLRSLYRASVGLGFAAGRQPRATKTAGYYYYYYYYYY